MVIELFSFVRSLEIGHVTVEDLDGVEVEFFCGFEFFLGDMVFVECAEELVVAFVKGASGIGAEFVVIHIVVATQILPRCYEWLSGRLV